MSTTPAAEPTAPHTAESLKPFLERYQAAWNGRDAAAMAPLLTEDIVWQDPALPAPARGVAEVQEFMRMSWRVFPDLRFGEPDPPHLSIAGEQVAWAWWMEGTMLGELDPPGFAPTGKSMRVDGVDLWELRGGRIARYRAFYDMNDLARQLGLAPAPGSRAEKVAAGLQRLQARLARRSR
jgi:steroid delta-isomerase-like uncharacterized protein